MENFVKFYNNVEVYSHPRESNGNWTLDSEAIGSADRRGYEHWPRHQHPRGEQ